jgi:hypothetical protein
MIPSDHFFMMAACTVNEGSSLYFWNVAMEISPTLFFCIEQEHIYKGLQRHLWFLLLVEASEQLNELQILLNDLQSDLNEASKWTYIWNSEVHSSKKGYLQIIGINDTSPIFQWMWKTCARGRHKFFFWLLLNDRLNTRNLLKRQNMDLQDYNCVLCS